MMFKRTLVLIIGLGIMLTAVAADTGFTVSPPPNLVVQFETTPLFQEANFAPGNTVTRWVKVTNNTAQTKQVLAKAINITDANALSTQIDLVVKFGLVTVYSGTLKGFFDGGENQLTTIASNTTIQYDFSATFNPTSGNTYQGKTVGFDLLVGFQATGPQPGTIIIRKATVGGNGSFNFTGNLGQFTIQTTSGIGTKTFANVSSGTYTVTEPQQSGWNLTSVVCTDPSNNSQANNRNAVIRLAAGETVTCTFTNTKR